MENHLSQYRNEPAERPGAGPHGEPMIDPADLMLLLRRHGKWLVAVPLLAGIGAVMLSFLSVPLFRSTTLLYVDPHFDQILRMERLEQPTFDDLDSLASLEEFVVSNTVLLRIADRLRLREEPGFFASGPLSRLPWPQEILPDNELAAWMREDRVSAKLVRNTRLLEISALDPDAERARRIVEAVAEEFERMVAERRSEEASGTLASLERQAGEAQRRALQAEERLKVYREEHAGLPIEQDSPIFTERMAQLGQELNAATARRVRLESQVEALRALDAAAHPLQVFEVMERESFGHVSDLLSRRAEALARLAVARRQYGESNSVYLAAADEARLAEDQVTALARDLKAGAEAEWEASRLAETQLAEAVQQLQAEQVRIKSVASGFRAIQQEVEKEWEVHRSFQDRLRENTLAAELATNIAMRVSDPMKAVKKAFPKRGVYLLAGGFLGTLGVFAWFAWLWARGLPWSGRRQLEARLARPVLADLSPQGQGFWEECLGQGRPDCLDAAARDSELTEALLTLGACQARLILFVTAGEEREDREASQAARGMAELSARHGCATLVLRLTHEGVVTDAGQLQPEPGSVPGLFTVSVPARVLLAPDMAPELVRHCRDRFGRIFVDATGLGIRGAVRQLAPLVDMVVLTVPMDKTGKAETEAAVAALSGTGLPPMALLLTGAGGELRETTQKGAATGARATEPWGWDSWLRALR